MKVTLALSKFYTNLNLEQADIDQLIEKIGTQLGAVEEATDLGAKYTNILVAKVISCEDHPNADRLHVCKIDDGGKAGDVERDEQGYVQVVCGAPNVREGLMVAWLPPGSTVPSTLDKDPFVLEARVLRGVVSNGMLASSKELAISDDHEGILEIDDETARPGMPFADVYHLNDWIIDIENKMFTHRPDCFGLLGVYREIAGIQQQQFEGPSWYNSGGKYTLDQEAETLPLEVVNELPELVPRFTTVVMSGISVKPSPIWLQIHLMRVGVRPINNIVDITNFIMYLTGQPLHAYDYDKVKAQDAGADHATMKIRYPHQDEKILLLNGKEVKPRPGAIMIASRDKLIGIGGVMGGGDTEVDENTKNIILECATFDMYSIRRTSMAHGLFTDAVTRFNKGQSPLQNERVIAKTVHEVRMLAGGKVASGLFDDRHLPDGSEARSSVHPPVVLKCEFVNVRLGLDLSAEVMAELLRNVEFDVQISEEELTVKAPFWRTDIEIPEDVVEEVGRLYGYDKLPLVLPKRDIAPAPKDQLLELKSRIRDTLSKAGANELLTYSFVHGNLLDKVGQDKAQAFQIANALSPDLQYYRLSLTPSLLEKVHPNIKAGQNEFALFEIGKAHGKGIADAEGLPQEFTRMALVFAADKKVAHKYGGVAYYEAKKYLTYLLDEVGTNIKIELKPLRTIESLPEGHYLIEQMLKPYEPNRSAVLWDGEMIVGVVGEYKRSVARALKLPDFCAGFETFHRFFALSDSGQAKYKALPRFPRVEQDICLRVAVDQTYQQLFDFVTEKVDEVRPQNTLMHISPVDIYQREDDHEHQQTTLRLSIASYERTLTDAEVTKLLDYVAEAAKEAFGAERV